jgi:hypothetical protein
MDSERIKELLRHHIEQNLSSAEESDLMNTISKMSKDQVENLIDEFYDTIPDTLHMPDSDAEIIFHNIIKHYKRVRRLSLIRWISSAAASVIIILASYYFAKTYIVSDNEGISVVNDFAPGGEKAMLKLADGSIISLDNVKDSTLMDGTKIKVQDNKLICIDDSKKQVEEIKYNTLYTPRGGEYKLALPDGTNVWLNAESSIIFPTVFPSNERRITITGEVYLEVAKLSGKVPFIVELKDKATIEVLGTHFNVNAYENEDGIRTTLIEGSVKVVSSATDESYIISPGQQALITKEGSLSVAEVNPEDVISWKNGRFMFDRADIKTIMRQLERWYNIDVKFEGEIKQDFGGAISKNVNLSKIFEMLEMAGDVKFEINDSTITVLQKSKRR